VSFVPVTRSGHVLEVYRDHLVLFGGIHEVTRELNDLCVFSFKNNEWIQLQEDDMSPRRAQVGQSKLLIPPQNAHSMVSQSTPGISPAKKGLTPGDHSIDSPLLKGKKPNRLMTAKPGHGTVRPSNTLAQLQKTYSLEYTKQVKLDSPTSVIMQDSFLIKNHNASNFDSYFKSMKKRHPTFGKEASPHRTSLHYGKVQGKKPPARDGHTGVIVGDVMIVFGGDRNRMPFNDTFKLDIRAVFEAHRL
jgi:Galactose oxidase, central domain